MASLTEIDKFKNKLLNRREEIFRLRNDMDHSKKILSQPEIEAEETASKSKMFFDIDILDEKETAEIRSIDRALTKIESGTYGYCESCGDAIPVERLEVLPWASLCLECSQKKDEGAAGALQEQTAPSDITVPEEFTGILDDELAETVFEKLLYDGRVNMEELRISAEGEKLYIEGRVPSNMEKEILLDILKNRMGLRNVVEHIVPDPLLWQSYKKTKGIIKDPEEENPPFNRSGSDSGDTGVSESPAEHFIPER